MDKPDHRMGQSLLASPLHLRTRRCRHQNHKHRLCRPSRNLVDPRY